MLLERLLLVLPSLRLQFDPLTVMLGAGVSLGVLGLFVLTVGSRLGQEEERLAGEMAASVAQGTGGVPSTQP
jgi:hypothetical protein